MTLTNKVYDTLKWVVTILLPALATLYFMLSKCWPLPYATEVVGTISAVSVFIGALIGISSANYAGDGDLLVNAKNEDGIVIEFNQDPDEMENHKKITLNVVK